MRILKGICDGIDGRYNHCGATNTYIVVKSRGQCKKCSDAFKNSKKPTRIPSAKKVQKAMDRLTEIQENQQYYLRAILANQKRNEGKVCCDECGEPIKHVKGLNVCHIIGSGANKKLYHNPLNHFILGKGELFGECECGVNFDDKGGKSEMRIFDEYENRKQKLMFDYYNKK